MGIQTKPSKPSTTKSEPPQFPHCDARILHAPGECEVCDWHPDWQQLREHWGIAFTGHEPTKGKEAWEGDQLPCPADYNRGDSHTRWGGNTPKPPGGVSLGVDWAGYEVRVSQDEFDKLSGDTKATLLELQRKLAD